MSTGALFVARITGPENLMSATAALQQCGDVRSWSAVNGHVHLIAALSTPAENIPRSLTGLSGLSEFHAYDIDDGGRTAVLDPALRHAYVFIEIDPARAEDIVRTLADDPQVAWHAVVVGGCEVIALIKHENFEALERHIERAIRPLDGVIRLKADRVIELRQL